MSFPFETTHERIQAKMNTDREWESITLAAEILEKFTGWNAFCKVLSKNAKTKGDIKKSSDSGDIYLFDKKANNVKVIEVKRLSESNISADFTSKYDYKYSDFIVDGVYQFNNKYPTPYMYMCFNSNLTAVILCYTKYRGNWQKKLKKGNESMKEYYIANLKDVKFFSVKELLSGSKKQD